MFLIVLPSRSFLLRRSYAFVATKMPGGRTCDVGLYRLNTVSGAAQEEKMLAPATQRFDARHR